MSYFKDIQINEHIYQIKDPMGVLMTLIIGNNKAMLIDTGYGIYDIKKHVESITNLPLIVVNSHGHMDHSCGNYLFEEVFIHEKDFELCKLHNSYDWRKRNLTTAMNMNLIDNNYNFDLYLQRNCGNLLPISYNEEFDLGNITIKTINMEGHTTGSVGFLIEEDNLLVTSDGACPFVWLFLTESTSVLTYIKMLENVLTLPFDGILVGHGAGTILPRQKIVDFLNCAKDISLEQSVQVYFNNFDHLNSYCYTKGKMYDQNDVGVVFDPNKLK
jgi:glyoxylase-like metal-dependent hydrolase (beta-lactamase superfamily II)